LFSLTSFSNNFFESSFPASFRILDTPSAKGTPTNGSSSLTTFANLGFSRASSNAQVGGSVGGSVAGVVPPGKGIRGVLDNIVTDGMRVAAEVRRRVDEAQKDLEKNALQRDDEDDDEEGEDYSRTPGGYSRDSDRRSVRTEDRDLLEGADAEAGSIKSQEGLGEVEASALGAGDRIVNRASTDSATEKVVEFER